MALFARQHRLPWRLVGPLLLLGVILGVHGLIRAQPRPNSVQALTTSADASLIVRPHTVSFSGTLAGATIEGTLSPSLPGLNSVSLRLVLPGERAPRGGWVALALEMPGMAMRPARAVLTTSGQDYRGSINVPMFGSYLARVVAATPLGRYAGTITIALPLSFSGTGSSSQAVH